MSAFTGLLLPVDQHKVLVVTNDFPPRIGGIQTFLRQLVGELPPDQVVVHTSAHPDAAEHDAEQPFTIVRDPASVLLPTRAAGRRVIESMRRHGCTQVVYGASAPLGLLARRLRRSGAQHQVAITHGHEVWWSALPLTRQALRRIADEVDVLTYVSDYTRRRIEPALSQRGRERFVRLAPEVDRSIFHPGRDGTMVRDRLGIPADALVVVCVGRLVRRKGQVDLTRVWPKVLETFPGAQLVLVGEGPDRRLLAKLVRLHRLEGSVHVAGAVPDVVAFLAAGDVFASPIRSRWFGLEVEAFGIAFQEAAAMGMVLTGHGSGGSREAAHGSQSPPDSLASGSAVARRRSAGFRLNARAGLVEDVLHDAAKREDDDDDDGGDGRDEKAVLDG